MSSRDRQSVNGLGGLRRGGMSASVRGTNPSALVDCVEINARIRFKSSSPSSPLHFSLRELSLMELTF